MSVGGAREGKYFRDGVLHAAFPLSFRQPSNDVILRAAAMGTAHAGDDAETARMIAAFGDFQIGKVPRRQAKARCIEIGNESRTRIDLDQ